MQGARVALYWTPDRDDPLWTAGNTWLGRDPELGVAVRQPDLPRIAAITSQPRVYGFHATLRPPMRLATGWEHFIAAAESVAATFADFDLPRLEVTVLDGFLALSTTVVCPDLHHLADCCVRATDPHRLRPEAAELARRRASSLTPDQDALLLRWGYPYVMDHWRFHMTLTGRLDDAEMADIRPAVEQHFAPALSLPRRASAIAVFTQAASAGAAPFFLVGERLKLLR